jgi:hypothetical protein
MNHRRSVTATPDLFEFDHVGGRGHRRSDTKNENVTAKRGAEPRIGTPKTLTVESVFPLPRDQFLVNSKEEWTGARAAAGAGR